MSNYNEIGFELYELYKNGNDVDYKNHIIKLESDKIDMIKIHILRFFENKNSYFDHYKNSTLPSKWLRAFSNPIENILNNTNHSIDFDLLLDTFIKEGLSPQSHNFSKRSKFLLIIYKKGEYFILAHLSVKSGITLDNENIEISQLLFYPDTLLRYIYITKNESDFDLVCWERSLTKTFIEFLSISENYLNKEFSGELVLHCEKSNYNIQIPFSPNNFLQKYISKEIQIKRIGNNRMIDLTGDSYTIKKIEIGEQVLKDPQLLGNQLFLIKTTINTSLSDSIGKYALIPQQSLLFDIEKLKIIEGKNIIQIKDETIVKSSQSGEQENIINFGLPLQEYNKQNNLDISLTNDFFAYIIDSISNGAKKTDIFSLYDEYNIEFSNEDFIDAYNNSNIFILNLDLAKNQEINETIKELKVKIKESDSNIIKELYKVIILQYIYTKIPNSYHLHTYIDYCINKQIDSFMISKASTFSESENSFIEYKKGDCLYYDKQRDTKTKSTIESHVKTKVKNIKYGLILYGFDETNRTIEGIQDNYFRKITDDYIAELESQVKQSTGINTIRIYKFRMGNNKNIMIIYIEEK